ncbi:MAG: sugar phosphate isomerase/epimerase [Undibacterium sp.]|nr:sugar phosphate isomerase/epimerase [Opitutaceae bacterium]
MNRRDFLLSTAAAAAVASFTPTRAAAQAPAATPTAAPAKGKVRAMKKGFMFATLNSPTAQKLSVVERFQLLSDAKFDGVEVGSAMNQAEVLAARDKTGIAIPSVVISTHWAKPLSDPNPTARQVGLDGLLQGLRDAKAYGASSVLLVPAVVNKDVSYADAYTRSVAEIAKAVPLAESLGVVIAIENVWNRFLLSPLEAVSYVDSFKSPMVRWHFDAGNVANTGWPEHWVHTLGSRIVKVHVKEFSRKIRDEKGPAAGFKVDLFEGDSDWPRVMAALDEVGYSGWMIAEQYRPPEFDDAAWLIHLSKKMDQVIGS